jgi:hypothetical protein
MVVSYNGTIVNEKVSIGVALELSSGLSRGDTITLILDGISFDNSSKRIILDGSSANSTWVSASHTLTVTVPNFTSPSFAFFLSRGFSWDYPPATELELRISSTALKGGGYVYEKSSPPKVEYAGGEALRKRYEHYS